MLDDVDLQIGQGTFWFLIGPNGSGKTTLLRAILGLIPPLRGDVWRDPERASLAITGFVPQTCAISPALPTTVREFVSLGSIGSQRTGSPESDLDWALERVGLTDLRDRDYRSLSGGQRQRALLARALVRRPTLLVLDEPTESLDTGAEYAFMQTLEGLRQEEDATLLLVTHRLQLALQHATDVAVVEGSRVRSGTRAEILGTDAT